LKIYRLKTDPNLSNTQVLKLEAGRRPGALGGSVFGYGDAHAALAPTLQRWRAAIAAASARGR
jgi:hypothetical protein